MVMPSQVRKLFGKHTMGFKTPSKYPQANENNSILLRLAAYSASAHKAGTCHRNVQVMLLDTAITPHEADKDWTKRESGTIQKNVSVRIFRPLLVRDIYLIKHLSSHSRGIHQYQIGYWVYFHREEFRGLKNESYWRRQQTVLTICIGSLAVQY
ncbi:hypothetical protein EJ08DRAFT_47605 [Tothia fuscella]|uniref:Uncharacterized protein n=1 Tax=Tothia fuscella TaxID=1048955 RepID=A0A9P4NFC3_9PEZI|nr:hypothetical protein EJ08DRAFT_47605 [Tothia fuscella]